MADFRGDAAGVAMPDGVDELGRNEGFVNVGTSHDTPAFAVASPDTRRAFGSPLRRLRGSISASNRCPNLCLEWLPDSRASARALMRADSSVPPWPAQVRSKRLASAARRGVTR